MTVVVQTPYNAHIANGVTTLFGFDFQLLDAADLQVSLDGVVQSTGFSIAGIGVQSGGSITFAVAPASNVLVEIQRLIPLARSTDYQLNGDLPSDQVDRDFDRLWQALQDQAYFAGLTIALPADDTAAPMVIPSVADRANRFFAFNALGQAMAAVGVPGAPTTDFAATLLDDPNAAAARTTLGLGSVATESVVPIAKGGTGEITAALAFAALKQAATEAATGVVELASTAEAQAGTDTTRVLTPARLKDAQIQRGTAVTLTNQTVVNFTGIPSWVNRITVLPSGLSTNGTASYFVRLGTSVGVESAGYVGKGLLLDTSGLGANPQTSGFVIGAVGAASVVQSGMMVIQRVTGNTWVAVGLFNRDDSASAIAAMAGAKTLSGQLDRIQLATANGTDQFDAGTVNISWE